MLTQKNIDISSLNYLIEIRLLIGKRARAYKFDLPIVIDENVGGMDIADLILDTLELIASTNHVIEQIPHLGLQEELVEALTVLNFVLQNEGIVFVGELI